jgi:hypothetical protein
MEFRVDGEGMPYTATERRDDKLSQNQQQQSVQFGDIVLQFKVSLSDQELEGLSERKEAFYRRVFAMAEEAEFEESWGG